jgi:4-amino-4-deoxy-L-arabinose transferase-like glycosyltransferase
MSVASFRLDSEEQNPRALLLAILAVLLFFPALGTRDFWAPVEPRYAEIARVMFAKGEWIVPSVNDDLYTDKPILYFWLVLVASNIAGVVNEWTVRLPAALGAVGSVLATYAIGKDFFNPRIGFIAAAVLATSARVIWEGRWAHVDMLFVFFFTLAMYFAARAILRKGNRREMIPAYAFMALATLTKGLIGVVLPALILFAFVIVRRDWRLLFEARLPWGSLIFLAIAAPWVLLVNHATDGKWLEDFIYIHHLQRYTAGVGHWQPFYYYLTTLPVDLLPWTIFALPALRTCKLNRELFADPASVLFLLWFAAVFLFFSASDTKRDLYLLPLFPVAALFVGIYIDGLASGKIAQDTAYRVSSMVFFHLLWVSSLVVLFVVWFVRRDALGAILPFATTMTCGGLAIVYFISRRSPWMVFMATTFTMVLGTLAAAVWFLPFLEQYKSPRPFSVEVKKRIPQTAPLYIYADSMNDYNFYMERAVIPVVRSEAQLQRLLSPGQPGYLLIKDSDLERMQLIDRSRIVFKQGSEGRVWYLIALGDRTPQ